MSLELVNTFGTLLTVAIIAATAIAAMVQLRHLRAGNQINAMLSISNQFDAKEFRDAVNLVSSKLKSTFQDPAYREYVAARNRRMPLPDVPEDYRAVAEAANLVGNTYEELGILVKKGIIDREIFLDRYSWVIMGAWDHLVDVVGWARAVTNEPRIWENFEYLTVIAQDFANENRSTYPLGMRRLETPCPWPVPPMPATA
ncbi:MAG TPA: hypothetical protein VFF60_03950 [Candidatus Binatus sp.]|nr:hypothetical protein [Candidatus Binatus sp.]